MNNVTYEPELERRRIRYPRLIAAGTRANYRLPLLLILLHIPLGVLLYNAGSFALIHPIGVFLIGMRRALRVDVQLHKVAEIAAYIVGAEILWRMAEIPIFWEFGKYGSAAIMIAAIIRRRLWKIPAFPVFYFVLLLPSCLITITENSLAAAKDTISFNMSGPFLLLISCWFFSHLELDRLQVRQLLMAWIVPLMSVAVTTLFYTVTAEEIQFTGESNFATSGGFGPNQVSAMLGLGAFLCLACLLLFKNSFNYNVFLGALAIFFTTQTVLTFSRGGIYNAVGAALLIVIFQMRDLREGIAKLIPILGIVAVFLLVVFPYLDNFTGGALQERFEDTDPTKRGDIAEADLKIFLEDPILGVGVGNAYDAREKYLNSEKAVSHTEFTRVIAEHGSFGIIALAALILMVVFGVTKQNSTFGKALIIGFFGWGTLFMLNAGMRLAAPSLIFGMIYLVGTKFQLHESKIPRQEVPVVES